jgi:hypothetical protein
MTRLPDGPPPDPPFLVKVTVEQMQAQLRKSPGEFAATIEHLLATCTDPDTIRFWQAVKEFARRTSDNNT